MASNTVETFNHRACFPNSLTINTRELNPLAQKSLTPSSGLDFECNLTSKVINFSDSLHHSSSHSHTFPSQMARLTSPPFSLILILSASWLLLPAESATYWGDREALKQLKNGFQNASVNPGSCVSSWDFSVDPCDNLLSKKFTCGFRCDVVVSGSSRVTEITLDQAGYAASLASSSWNLPYLETLDVSNNYFSGGIPETFANLTRLRRLALSGNLLDGEIPSSIGFLSNLEELYLDNNNLQGTIPPSLNGLKSLKRLELQLNNLQGEIPDLGSLENLYYLDISDNAVTGGIPATLPKSLVQISMRNNCLSGGLRSESFRGLTDLQVLDLSYNSLKDTAPVVLFELPSLEQLSLSFNKLSAMEAPSYNAGSQSGLIAVDVSNNEIQGLLPWFMGVMPKLSSLSLENNKFTGMIPTQYALKTVFPEMGISPFERLILSGNYLIGGIPSPLLVLKPGSANVTLGDNCLFRCPLRFFFCDQQKSLDVCNRFSPFIP